MKSASSAGSVSRNPGLVRDEAVAVAHGRRVGEADAAFAIGRDGLAGLGGGVRALVVPARVVDGGAPHAQVTHGAERGAQFVGQVDHRRPVEERVLQKVVGHALLDR